MDVYELVIWKHFTKIDVSEILTWKHSTNFGLPERIHPPQKLLSCTTREQAGQIYREYMRANTNEGGTLHRGESGAFAEDGALKTASRFDRHNSNVVSIFS